VLLGCGGCRGDLPGCDNRAGQASPAVPDRRICGQRPPLWTATGPPVPRPGSPGGCNPDGRPAQTGEHPAGRERARRRAAQRRHHHGAGAPVRWSGSSAR